MPPVVAVPSTSMVRKVAERIYFSKTAIDILDKMVEEHKKLVFKERTARPNDQKGWTRDMWLTTTKDGLAAAREAMLISMRKGYDASQEYLSSAYRTWLSDNKVLSVGAGEHRKIITDSFAMGDLVSYLLEQGGEQKLQEWIEERKLKIGGN